MASTIIKAAAEQLLDILYPPMCIVCSANVDKAGTICTSCWNDINFISDPQCRICGFPFAFTADENLICTKCIQDKPKYSKARAVFVYDNASSKMVTSFKYNDRTENRKAYAKWMARVGATMLSEADYIVPVPLHFKKLLLRKYNQAAILANEVGKLADKKVLTTALIRKKHTQTQAGFSQKARFNNISGAFNVNPKYAQLLIGKKILLIDDVITTGATASECAKVLLKAKVERVEVLTLAKTLF